MGKKNKDNLIELSDREKRISALKSGKIPKDYLLPLLMSYKKMKEVNPNAQMPKELAEVVLIIIDKNLGSPSWRRYTPEWKEEMRGRAIEHILKYCHNFDPNLSACGNDEPYNYIAMIANMAFIQSLKKLKKHSEHNVSINHAILYNDSQWVEFEDIKIEIETQNPNINNLEWGKLL